MRVIAIAVAGLMLAGCSYNLSLMSRGGGKTGSGTASRPGNDVTIMADGVTYKGRFTYMEGGFAGVSTGFAGGMAATGTMVGTTGQGNGNIMARSDDGKGMRCQFGYSGWSNSGMGVCQDDAGTIYDLQISR